MNDQATVIGYKILDTHTGQQVGKPYGPTQRKRAQTRADRLDNQYGAYRYRRVTLWSDGTEM